VLALLFVTTGDGTPQLVLALSLAATLVVAVAMVPVVWRVGMVPLQVDLKLLRRMLWLSIPLIGLLVSQYVLSAIDIVVLRLFRSEAEVGIYAAAYQAYTKLSLLAVSVTVVLEPLLVSLQIRGRRQIVVRYFERVVPQMLFAIMIFTGLLIPFIPLLVPVAFGPGFAASAGPLAVLSIGLVFLFGAYLVAPILTLHELTRPTAVITAVAAVINIVADFVMVGLLHIGIVAPALATSGALAYMFFAYFERARDVLDSPARLRWALFIPFLAGLGPTLIVGGWLGVLVGVGGVVVTALAIVTYRSPFMREDLDLIEAIRMPSVLRIAARKVILLAS
jgi:O-antigen/teichoic acid export membrane protein